ncbi:hypothetical protein LTR28_011160, partial [Elasticomyces elasticus]
ALTWDASKEAQQHLHTPTSDAQTSSSSSKPSRITSPDEPRRDYDTLFDNLDTPPPRRRRFSLGLKRADSFGKQDIEGDDAEGDLGYTAAEDREGLRRKVIVERLEMVKARSPVFTWC